VDVSLTPKLKKLIKEKVDSGVYHSASQVVGEALRLLDERDRLDQIKLQALRRDIQDGIDSGEATLLDVEAIKAAGRRQLARRKRKTRR
jgi:antitoxin ParD1/3/4